MLSCDMLYSAFVNDQNNLCTHMYSVVNTRDHEDNVFFVFASQVLHQDAYYAAPLASAKDKHNGVFYTIQCGARRDLVTVYGQETMLVHTYAHAYVGKDRITCYQLIRPTTNSRFLVL
jgi:hypothetical protein